MGPATKWLLRRKTKKEKEKEKEKKSASQVSVTLFYSLWPSPFFILLQIKTKQVNTDSADSARPIHYSTFDASPPSPAPSLSPTSFLMQIHIRDVISEHAASPSTSSSLTHVHRCIGSRNATRQTLPTSAKLTYLSVCDNRDGVSEYTAPPSPSSSLTHVHRCIGSRNATRQTLPTSAKLTHLSMYDSRDGVRVVFKEPVEI
jgi:hypothetical protein